MLGEPSPFPSTWGTLGFMGCPDFTDCMKEVLPGQMGHGQVSAEDDGAVPGLLPWGITASHLFPEYVPLLYKQSHIFFLKLYSPLIQFLIIVPYHAQCVSAALRKLSLVVNLTPANSQSS